MKLSSRRSGLLEGAFILSAAAILSKLIGTLQKIPLQNLGGDAVFGIYNTVNPLYTLIVTFAMLGLPAAVSKFVAETAADGREAEGKRVLQSACLLSGISGFLLAFVTYAGAPLIARWIGNSHITEALRAVSFALLFVPVMSALRGYFQGQQNMMPTAVSQIVEQTVRVAVMLAALMLLTRQGAGAEGISAGAMLGSVGGGAAGLAVMLLYWLKRRRIIRPVGSGPAGRLPADEANPAKTAAASAIATNAVDITNTANAVNAAGATNAVIAANTASADSPTNAAKPAKPAKPADARSGRKLSLAAGKGIGIRALLSYSVPVMFGSLAVTLIGLVDVFTMPRLLAEDGSEAGAMVKFGIYNRGLPLVQLVTMMATSLSVMFIPALAEAKYKGDVSLIDSRCRLSLRWFWLLGLAASVGLAVLAEPINIALYGDNAGSATMRLLAFTAASGTLSVITAALLQGLGEVRAPALHLLAAALLKAALNLLLIPQQGIAGAAAAGVAAYFLAAALNMRRLRQAAGLRLSLSEALAKPALVTAALGAAAWAVAQGAGLALGALGLAGGRMAALAETLAGVLAGCAVFAVLTVRLRLISEPELRQLPGFGARLTDKLSRWKLFPRNTDT